MPLSRKRNWKGRDRTEKRLRAKLRRLGSIGAYFEMLAASKQAALAEAETAEAPPEVVMVTVVPATFTGIFNDFP